MHIYLVTQRAIIEQKNEIYEKMNSLSYPMEGKYRKGFNRPQVSKLEFWDIRLRKENVAQFLLDIQVVDPARLVSSNDKHHINPVIRWGVWLIRRLIGINDTPEYKPVHVNKTKRHPFFGYCYCILIGCKKDPVDEEGVEML